MNMLDMSNILQWSKPLPRAGTEQSWMYPICIVLGFIVAIVLACIKMWKRYKISVEPFYWFILIGVPTAIIGANFGSCVLGEPAGKPWSEFFTKFGQGLAIEWGVLFTVIAAAIYFPLILRKPKYRIRDEFGPVPEIKQVSFWLYVDAVMPCILIAQFIGRWGNYCNQEVYGAVVTDQSMINFLQKFLPGMEIRPGEWHQPLFFWEGIANLGMFFVLYFGVEFIKVREAGDMGGLYLIWYGALRLGLEPLRDQQYKSQTTMIFSSIFVAVGFIFVVINHAVLVLFRNKRNYGIYAYTPTGMAVKTKFQNKFTAKCIKKVAHFEKLLAKEAQEPKTPELQNKMDKDKAKLEKWQHNLKIMQAENANISKCTPDKIRIYYGAW